MDRREFLKKSILLTAGTLIGGKLLANALPSDAAAAVASGRKKKEIGLQLYSLRQDFGKDVPGTIKKVADMGYTTVETASYANGKLYGYSGSDFKKLCGDHGLKVTGAHVGQSYSKETHDKVMDWWKQCLDTQAEAGCKYVVQPSFPIAKTLDGIKLYCDYFNEVGDMTAARNMSFGFHNHDGEFRSIDNKIIYDYMIENTDPNKVMFELDVFWITRGGQDPVDYINKYGSRIPILHIKDDCAVGDSGKIDYEAIFKAAYKNKLEAFYVEVENCEQTPEIAVQRSFDFLDTAKFVK